MKLDSFTVTVHDEFGGAALQFDERASGLHIGVPDGRYVLCVQYGGVCHRIRVLVEKGRLVRAWHSVH
jgi:hypothetical protein